MSEIDKLSQNDSGDDKNENNNQIETTKSDSNEINKANNENLQIETGDEVFDEVINKLPEEEKKMIMKGTMSMLQMSSSNHIVNPIAKKITEEHITKFLDTSKQNMELDYKEKEHNKLFIGFVILMTMIFIIAIIILLKNTPDTM